MCFVEVSTFLVKMPSLQNTIAIEDNISLNVCFLGHSREVEQLKWSMGYLSRFAYYQAFVITVFGS